VVFFCAAAAAEAEVRCLPLRLSGVQRRERLQVISRLRGAHARALLKGLCASSNEAGTHTLRCCCWWVASAPCCARFAAACWTRV